MSTLEGDPDLFSWTDTGGSVHFLNADLVITVDDLRTSTLTKHPVESGANVTDHVQQNADTIKISLAQTQTPIEAISGFDFKDQTVTFAAPKRAGFATIAVGALTDALGITSQDTSATITALQAASELDRVSDIHDQLISIKVNAYPVTVTFKGREYTNFIITSVKLTHAKGEFGLGRFELDAEEFRTVTTATATLPDPKDLRAKQSKGQGKKGSEAAADAPVADLRSTLRSAVKALGGS